MPLALSEGFNFDVTPYEAALAKVANLRQLDALSEKEAQLLKRNLRRDEQRQIEQVAANAANAITALWPKSKNAAIAAAIINTAKGVTNALSEGPTPFALANAALIAAAGAAQIATIRSTNLGGGGGGGAPAPSSGGGAATASPTAPQGSSLTIEGLDPAALYGGKQLAEFLAAINNAVQNGARLISTRNLPV